jgi:hypothetical protein
MGEDGLAVGIESDMPWDVGGAGGGGEEICALVCEGVESGDATLV